MRILTLLVSFFMSLPAFAARTPSGETIGGPFKGSCKVLENGNAIDSFSFDTKPDSKVGMKLHNGLNYGDYFVQVINNSFKNSLSVAVIFVRQAVENPPRACLTRGQYQTCDYIQKRWRVPPRTEPGTEPRLVPLFGSLEIIDSGGIKGGIAQIVDSYSETIDADNSGFSDRIELKIKDSQVLKCEVSYVDLF